MPENWQMRGRGCRMELTEEWRVSEKLADGRCRTAEDRVDALRSLRPARLVSSLRPADTEDRRTYGTWPYRPKGCPFPFLLYPA